MIGKVKTVTKSKSGKAFRVQFEGSEKWYGAFLDSGLDKAVGRVIDAQITPDKGFGEGVGQWGFSAEPAPPSAPTQAPTVSGRLTEPELRFVSNILGAAVTAKTITDPLQIGVWAKAAAQAVKEV